MKKVILILVIVIIVIVGGAEIIFTINKSNDKSEEESKVTEEVANEEDVYYLKTENMEIRISEEFSKEKFGEEEEYSEIASCAFDGLDKTYKYTDYEITTYPDGEKDKIYSIYFLSEDLKTTEGVKLSDDMEKMINTYGENYENIGNQYTYVKGNTSIEFIVENDVITSIQYVYVAE